MAEENVFQSVLDCLQLSLSQIAGGETTIKSTDDFVLQNFWLKLCVSTKCLSNEVTKLCVMFSKPPVPAKKEVNELLKAVEAAYLEVLSTFYTLPKEQGQVLRKEVQRAMLKLLEALVTVIVSLKDKGAKGQKDRLKLTGWVWEACEAVEVLPKDNLAAACKQLQKEEMLVMDALQEIEDEVKADTIGYCSGEEEPDNSETWSNHDRELLPPCMGLVKTARSCLKRVGQAIIANGRCDSEQYVLQLDDLVAAVEQLSPVVDDFVSSVYPPMSRDAVKSCAIIVVKKIQAVLQLVRQSHYVQDDLSWVDFLLKAVDHNNNKLQPLLTK